LEDGLDTVYAWDYYGGGTSSWVSKILNTGSELGGNPDGIAFDPTNGDLYMSGDGTGVYQYDRVTAVRGALIPGTGDGSLNGLGYDLAFQTTTSSINRVPGPLPIFGVATALAFSRRLKRRIKASTEI
jgi:secreted PhoX family phosphatase